MECQQESVVAELRELFRQKGGSMYGGEAVTQLQHGLQSGLFAEEEEATDATIAAAFLHDIGHLLHDLPENAPDDGIDDVHEKLASRWLSKKGFPQEVIEPIRLHVQAKRYLCTVDPSYQATLSEPSVQSMKLQGGLLNPEEIAAFEQHALFKQIIQVRRIDDRAKIKDLPTPDAEHYLKYVSAVL